VELTRAAYFAQAADLPLAQVPTSAPARSGLRLRLSCHAGLMFSQLDCDAFEFHINAADDLAVPLYELVFAQCVGAAIVQGDKVVASLGSEQVCEVGFEDEEALLPYGKQSFQGYRLLHEYFAFPQRFLFFAVQGLSAALRTAHAGEIELVLLFCRHEPRLDGALDAGNFSLYATPVANLFERRADRMPVNDGEFEHHLVIDRTRPLDYEVFSVQRLRGYGVPDAPEVEFLPFYAAIDAPGPAREAYYTLRREPRLASSRQQQGGSRSSHVGTEVFVALVDAHEAPYPEAVKQLGAEVWATNRDLPLLLPVAAQNPLSLEASAPVSRITMIRGPTRPRPGAPEGDFAWRLVHHLSLNHLSLIDGDDGASALRSLLELYAAPGDPAIRRQIEALQSVTSRPVVRRLPIPGPIAFGRGIDIELRIDETRLPGSGGFLLGAILDRFFAQYVSINAFIQTRLVSDSRAEVHRWPPRTGRKTLA
jgi:type VI secretion system protein ImpG